MRPHRPSRPPGHDPRRPAQPPPPAPARRRGALVFDLLHKLLTGGAALATLLKLLLG